MGPEVRLRPRLFTRPLPVAAALVMVLNDHVLKGSGWLPGVVTGKLSDFAGLYFSPLLLAELWLLWVPAANRRGIHRRLWLSALLIAVPFCAIKVSSLASTLYLRAMGWLHALWGAPVANVVDPTDLLALGCVPLAVWSGYRWARST